MSFKHTMNGLSQIKETEIVATLAPVGDKSYECFEIVAKDQEHLKFLMEDRYSGMKLVSKYRRVKQ